MYDRRYDALEELLIWVSDEIKENGGCDHQSNICYCGVTSNVVLGYVILHSHDPSKHNWIGDFEWDSTGNIKKIYRCEKCYEDKDGKVDQRGIA